jgi:hypothetical protein
VVGEPGSLVGLSRVRRETTRLHSISDLSVRRIGAMDRPSLTGSRERQSSVGAPGVGLRADQPLLRAREAIAYTWRQWVHVAAISAGSGIAWLKSEQWAMPLACSSGSVLLALTALLGTHRQRERHCAIALILEGEEGLPIAAVQRERRRLLSEPTRRRLVRRLEDAVRHGHLPVRSVSLTPPRFERMVVAMVADELREVIALLGAAGPSACGVARIERLVDYATSPLYGRDANPLRDELSHIRDPVKDRTMS